MERRVYPGEFYRHFKNILYQILAVATHSETGEKMVVYQALYGDFGVYVRPYEMFVSAVDREKYPEVTQEYRFERVELAAAARESGDRDRAGGFGNFAEAGSYLHGEVMAAGSDESKGIGIRANSTSRFEEEVRTQEPVQKLYEPSPAFLKFLDADTYEERMECLSAMARTAQQRDLDSLYLVLDMKPETGTIPEQVQAIGRFLTLQNRFDGKRLR